jgi:hypothetical protein
VSGATNVAPFIMPDRQLASWIAGFLDYTEGMQSPIIHRRWAALATVAGVMERKVWLRSQGENIYPNVYVFLVGPPGTGKTRALMASWRLWNTLEGYHVAEISLTKAALIDRLSQAKRSIHTEGIKDYHSLLVAVPELGALLPAYDSDFMNTLTHLYDGHLYTERRRSAKQEFEPIENPNICLIACTTPGFLISALPASAWNEGFLSRVCIAYSGEVAIKEFDLGEEKSVAGDAQLRSALIHDLRKISERTGKMGWTARAIEMAEDYNKREFDISTEHGIPILPKPTHPRLMHYNTRRPVHFLKLCLICAVDRGAPVIDIPDVVSAVDFMVEVEKAMPDVFTAMSSGGDAQVITDCLYWVMTENVRAKDEGVPMHLVHEYLASRAPATHVQRIFELMVKAKMIRVIEVSGGYIIKTRPQTTQTASH